MSQGFVPPPYPYDRLKEIFAIAERTHGEVVDLSIGTPCDPPPRIVLDAIRESGSERGYPPSPGTPALREAICAWFDSFLGVSVSSSQTAATVGSKEFVAGLPHWLKLRTPDRSVVLYPEVAYPSYAMGATLAGCEPVAVPVRSDFSMDLGAIPRDKAEKALCLWVNSPGNPAGGLEDLEAAAAWGRAHSVPVFSDECYVAFTWTGQPASILQHGTDGVVAVHSLSKRTNLAGMRVGFYAGDAELVHYLSEVRKHAGFMVAGPSQAAATAALGDERHVDEQRERYWRRLERMARILEQLDVAVEMPQGAFYLFPEAPDGDAWK
ncbi:MAG: aminotransferase class I/II-fold pyridoxal phosphate-dependent enzyme, partial [Acidimicrobiales bacterium]